MILKCKFLNESTKTLYSVSPLCSVKFVNCNLASHSVNSGHIVFIKRELYIWCDTFMLQSLNGILSVYTSKVIFYLIFIQNPFFNFQENILLSFVEVSFIWLENNSSYTTLAYENLLINLYVLTSIGKKIKLYGSIVK